MKTWGTNMEDTWTREAGSGPQEAQDEQQSHQRKSKGRNTGFDTQGLMNKQVYTEKGRENRQRQ